MLSIWTTYRTRLLVLACYQILPHFQSSLLQFVCSSPQQGVNQAHGYAIRNNYDQSVIVVVVLMDASIKGWVFFNGFLKVFELIGDTNKIVWR